VAVRQLEVRIVHDRLVANVAELLRAVAVLADYRVVAATLLIYAIAGGASSTKFDVDVGVVIQT